MRLTSRVLGLALPVLLAGCGSNQAVAPSPSPEPSLPPPTFAASPSPVPHQRQEPALPAAIEEAAAAVAGGRLYVMGGFNAAGSSLAGVYVFDGTAWTSGPSLPLPLDHPSAATLDGVVYIAGGHSNGRDSARAFRLDGDRWTAVASMGYARGGHALIAAQGKLYAIGGNTARGNVAPVEAYDPTANAWTTVSSMPQPRNHVLGFTMGTAVCVAGGRAPTTARVDCLDVISGAWSRLADLPQATSGGGAATFLGGDVVAMGGQDASETRIVSQLARYVPAGAWTSSDPMLIPRHGFELAVFNGRAWACGGGSSPGLHPVATCTSVGNPAAGQRGK
jgi:N-acetylneuraminic acid mutarotase